MIARPTRRVLAIEVNGITKFLNTHGSAKVPPPGTLQVDAKPFPRWWSRYECYYRKTLFLLRMPRCPQFESLASAPARIGGASRSIQSACPAARPFRVDRVTFGPRTGLSFIRDSLIRT